MSMNESGNRNLSKNLSEERGNVEENNNNISKNTNHIENIQEIANPDNKDLKKAKIIRYSILIGIILFIIIMIVVIIVLVKKKKDEPTNPSSEWDNLFPIPSESELKQLIKSSYNITTKMTQSEIQEILNNNSYQNIHFESGIYNIEIKYKEGINFGLKFSRKKYVILDKNVIFNLIGDPYKELTDYYVIQFVRVNATKEEPMNFYGRLEINGNRNPSIDKDYKGQCGMGLAFYSSHHINFQEIYSYNNHGDGIYLGSGVGKTETGEIQCNFCTNIKINQATCKNNYRNGISIIAGTDVKINKIYLNESNGSLPEAGIDFEPNNICEFIDIKINKIYSYKNNRCGVTTYPASSDSIKVEINEVHSDHDADIMKTGNFGFFGGTDHCDKIKYFYDIHHVYFNVVEGRDKDKYIVKADWGEDCNKLTIGDITFVE